METVSVNTSQHVDIDYPVAGLGERVAARLIDLSIFLGLYILFLIVTVNIKSSSSMVVLTMIVVFGAAYVFYNLICEILMGGQSVGKRVMKIKVISLDGGQPSLGQYFIRWIFRLVDFILTGQVGGLICIIVTEKKQRIGDIVAGTTLIKTIPRTAFDHIAFHPVEEGYVPLFPNVHQLSDRDVELLHEVVHTFYKTANFELLHAMSAKVAKLIGSPMPRYEDELDYLNTVIKDYNHVTSLSE